MDGARSRYCNFRLLNLKLGLRTAYRRDAVRNPKKFCVQQTKTSIAGARAVPNLRYSGPPGAWTESRTSPFINSYLIICICIVVLQFTDMRTARISRSAAGFWSDLLAVYCTRTALNELCCARMMHRWNPEPERFPSVGGSMCTDENCGFSLLYGSKIR
jgi:hypothetical protein